MSDYICKNGFTYIKPRYDVVIMNSPIDYTEPLLEIIDRYDNKVYRFTPQMIIEMAKKEGLINGN